MCVLCNNTLSFYSLPELSPAFGNTIVSGCSWVGGLDLNINDVAKQGFENVMICIKNRIRLIRIGDEPRLVRNIDFPGCLAAARRDNFACVADSGSYSLIDIENQQKINLFPISSLDGNAGSGRVEDISPASEPRNDKTLISRRPNPTDSNSDPKLHSRSNSLGNFVASLGKRQGSPASKGRERFGINTPEPSERATSPARVPLPNRPGSASGSPVRQPPISDKPLPPPPEQPATQRILPTGPSLPIGLRPHIVSPSFSEFLLTTGTIPTEPGVAIFVNLDGDVVRGTLQFSRYPTAVVVDGTGSKSERGVQFVEDNYEGHVLAAVSRPGVTQEFPSIEIQQLNLDDAIQKEWLDIPVELSMDANAESDEFPNYGLRAVHTAVNVPFPEIGISLRAARLNLASNRVRTGEASEKNHILEDWEARRNMEENKFGQRLGGRECQIVVWSGSSIWWIVKNPLAMRLDSAIDQALHNGVEDARDVKVDRAKMIKIINSLHGQEANTETEFLSLEYIRQKISLILFCDLLVRSIPSQNFQRTDAGTMEALLMESNIDPRVILTMIPSLQKDIFEGPKGIWIHSGLLSIIEHFWSLMSIQPRLPEEQAAVFKNDETMSLLKKYLFAWRQRKGFGSVADEVEVFQTVDAAILHLLLSSDSLHFSGHNISSSRAELYSIVDSGVDCFDRAVALLEHYRRFYLLSRLYGSRKMAEKVLQTWRRIIDGEKDAANELVDGENEVRKYLIKIRDPRVVHEYGAWLARRNPALGVQVYTDDNSKVKMAPHEVVELLRERAPEAVKFYLEHLVFGKKNFQYANDLISYYLDNVLFVLGSSREAREILSQSYETYRALDPPKPTYRQFIIDNPNDMSWWHDRLRLLELLGGSHGTDFAYNVESILSRIEPFEQDLVPESIILDGRQGRHQQALRLLTHGLGDYHTAINYCLLGGASIFYPASAPMSPTVVPTSEEQATLFGYLLGEFLGIEDITHRLERTSELLERFGSWYDVSEVLGLIPESWSVELISGYLINTFRHVVQESNEALITKALSGAENLQIASTLVEKCSAVGPQLEDVQ